MAASALSLKAYESLLLHLPITVFTDNSVVLNIRKYKPVNAREKRLLAYIAQFNLTLKFVAGSSNRVADCLSRIQADMLSQETEILRPSVREEQADFILSINPFAPTDDYFQTSPKTQTNAIASTNSITVQSEDDSNLLQGTHKWQAYRFQILSKNIETHSALSGGIDVISGRTTEMTSADTPSSQQNLVIGEKSVDSLSNLNPDAPIFRPTSGPEAVRRSTRIAERNQRRQMNTNEEVKCRSVRNATDPESGQQRRDKISDALAIDDENDRHLVQPRDNAEAPTTSELLSRLCSDDSLNAEEPDTCNIGLTAELVSQMTDHLNLQPSDYETDSEFSPMYKFLLNGELTGDDEIDRKTLLLVENYYISNGLLFKISLPRNKKEERMRPAYHQMCVPQPLRNALITDYHELVGHNGLHKMHLMLIQKYFWKSMMKDISEVLKQCHICQCSKLLTHPPVSPMHPLPVPQRPGQMWAFDHKVLSRKTEAGNAYILVFVDHFSGYCIFSPVPDQTAFTTALTFVREVIARWGPPEFCLSDKAPAFLSIFFDTIAKLLNIRHRTSAAGASRTNGMCENAIRRLNQGLRLYANDEVDDTKIEWILPLIEYSIRASPLANLKISPFEIIHGYPMPLPVPLEHQLPTFASTDASAYAKWLKTSLQLLHKSVRINRLCSKQEMKEQHDKRYNVTEPNFKIGDKVYMKETHIKPHSSRILTKKPYTGPLVIKDIIRHDKTIGPAYKLVEMDTGRELKRLISIDRLKPCYTTDETKKDETIDTARNTTVITNKAVGNNELSGSAGDTRIIANKAVQQKAFRQGLKIVTDEWVNDQHRYLVLLPNRTVLWKNYADIGPGLLNEYYQRNY